MVFDRFRQLFCVLYFADLFENTSEFSELEGNNFIGGFKYILANKKSWCTSRIKAVTQGRGLSWLMKDLNSITGFISDISLGAAFYSLAERFDLRHTLSSVCTIIRGGILF